MDHPASPCGYSAHHFQRGADIEAEDTYGMRPLHRIASNNLAAGALSLLEAGADPRAVTSGRRGEAALTIARAAGAAEVMDVLATYLQRSA